MTPEMYNMIVSNIVMELNLGLEGINKRLSEGDTFTNYEIDTYFRSCTLESNSITGISIEELTDVIEDFNEEIGEFRHYPRFNTYVDISAYEDGEISSDCIKCSYYTPLLPNCSAFTLRARMSADAALKTAVADSLNISDRTLYLQSQAVQVWLRGDMSFATLVAMHKKI